MPAAEFSTNLLNKNHDGFLTNFPCNQTVHYEVNRFVQVIFIISTINTSG